MSHFINTYRKKLGRFLDRQRLQNKAFSLFSNDCWGAEVYKHFGLPFNTPFIGLMLSAPCYVRLVANPRHYLAQPLEFQAHSKYDNINELQSRWAHHIPVATLGSDVEIQFLHYRSDEEARDKWSRRVQRINWNNIFLKFDAGKDRATAQLVQEFDQLPFPRLTLLREPQAGIASAVVVPRYTEDGLVQFERSLPYLDLAGWLNGGSMRASEGVQLYNKLLFPVG